ncbi:hypothetical protein DICVIV_11235 [Dictyocaulus viviparus]|uniref:Uncharacterized protein n=1 Tax=Dictyocaulus viviparus TaxID=29172 RepID=A0A0D8XKE2_DICVI|nr:hypothetical protein DICVIV_11235 [Dictyocaulus viviparus]
MHNIDKINRIVPASVIIVILVFALMFNIIGTTLLFLYRRSEARRMSILGCAVISLLASVIDCGVIGLFVKFPPVHGTTSKQK